MKLPRFLRRSRPSPEAAEAPAPEQWQSKALEHVARWLDQQYHPYILDLGSASGANLDFYARYGSQVEFLDLHHQIEKARSGSNDLHRPDGFADAVRGLLRGSGGEADDRRRPFDLILAWDVLDYITPEQIKGLSKALHPRCRRGTRLFAQVSYTGTIPARPVRMTVVGEERLQCETEHAVRPSPQYTEPLLLKNLKDFGVDQSCLLRRGTREFVLVDQRVPEAVADSVAS